jgi:hypothetical protein
VLQILAFSGIGVLKTSKTVTQVVYSSLVASQLSLSHCNPLLRGLPLSLAGTVGNLGVGIPIVGVEIGSADQIPDT